MPSVEGLGARRAALQMLDAVLRRGQTLDAAGGRVSNLSPPDHALAIAISGEVLRRLPDLDSMIDGATRQRLPDDSKARMVLRLALAQKVGLKTPDHALVSTALPLVDGGPRRLVHGVLGTLLRRGVLASDAPALPAPVEERWGAAWGEPTVSAARRQIAKRPPLDLSFADDREAQSYARTYGGASLAPNHVRVESSSVSSLPGYETGRWWVQDLAASLPVRTIARQAMDILDLCAAPGGKTMQLAAAGHVVTSLDSSQSRLGRLRENLDRTKLDANLVQADALQWEPGREYDSVLLDAPCSATGTFRRHPEVLYRASPRIVADNADLQRRLLARAARWVKAGGALIYSVCSLEPAEGEEAIEDFLAQSDDFTLEAPFGLPDFARPSERGFVRILPGLLEAEGGLDGFFIARLVRRG
jgi:16S rRNA (cytosine967-C5)-methyltransferase